MKDEDEGVLGFLKDVGNGALDLGKEALDFLILDDLNTLADGDASLLDKGIAAASFIPIGKVFKGAKLIDNVIDSNVDDVVKKSEKTNDVSSVTGKKRPSWRQSEKDVGKDYPGYRDQVSFKDGKEVSHGSKNSSRPDFYNNGHSIEVKNYKISTSSGRSNLISNVTKQINKRIHDLPENTAQTVIIDVRGQEISRDVLRDVRNRINEKAEVEVEIIFKMD